MYFLLFTNIFIIYLYSFEARSLMYSKSTEEDELEGKSVLVQYDIYSDGRQNLFGMTGTEEPPGMTPSRLSQPPMMPPACCSISCLSGIDISSSTVHGLFTWPEMLYSCTHTRCTDCTDWSSGLSGSRSDWLRQTIAVTAVI